MIAEYWNVYMKWSAWTILLHPVSSLKNSPKTNCNFRYHQKKSFNLSNICPMLLSVHWHIKRECSITVQKCNQLQRAKSISIQKSTIYHFSTTWVFDFREPCQATYGKSTMFAFSLTMFPQDKTIKSEFIKFNSIHLKQQFFCIDS